jgi:hypothetical protein
MQYILYILYRYYYNGSNNTVAYVQSIFILLTLFGLNIFTIAIALDQMYLFDFLDVTKGARFLLIFLLYVVPGYVLLSTIVKRRDLENPNLESKYKKFHGFLFALYFILTVSIFMLSTFMQPR